MHRRNHSLSIKIMSSAWVTAYPLHPANLNETELVHMSVFTSNVVENIFIIYVF